MGRFGRSGVRAKFLRILLLYFLILIPIQLAGLLYILQDPSPHKVIAIAILLGAVLPVVLGLVFARLVRAS